MTNMPFLLLKNGWYFVALLLVFLGQANTSVQAFTDFTQDDPSPPSSTAGRSHAQDAGKNENNVNLSQVDENSLFAPPFDRLRLLSGALTGKSPREKENSVKELDDKEQGTDDQMAMYQMDSLGDATGRSRIRRYIHERIPIRHKHRHHNLHTKKHRSKGSPTGYKHTKKTSRPTYVQGSIKSHQGDTFGDRKKTSLSNVHSYRPRSRHHVSNAHEKQSTVRSRRAASETNQYEGIPQNSKAGFRKGQPAMSNIGHHNLHTKKHRSKGSPTGYKHTKKTSRPKYVQGSIKSHQGDKFGDRKKTSFSTFHSYRPRSRHHVSNAHEKHSTVRSRRAASETSQNYVMPQKSKAGFRKRALRRGDGRQPVSIHGTRYAGKPTKEAAMHKVKNLKIPPRRGSRNRQWVRNYAARKQRAKNNQDQIQKFKALREKMKGGQKHRKNMQARMRGSWKSRLSGAQRKRTGKLKKKRRKGGGLRRRNKGRKKGKGRRKKKRKLGSKLRSIFRGK